jgi:hypothetical protein
MKNKHGMEIIATAAAFLIAMLVSKMAMVQKWGIYQTYIPHQFWVHFQSFMIFVAATMVLAAIIYVAFRKR